MSKYVMMGGPFEITDHPEFSGQQHQERVFGDALEMPDALANRAISEGAALLPEKLFAAVGFTAEEIKKYPNARVQTNAPESWKQKHYKARLALHDYRLQLAAAPATTEEVTINAAD